MPGDLPRPGPSCPRPESGRRFRRVALHPDNGRAPREGRRIPFGHDRNQHRRRATLRRCTPAQSGHHGNPVTGQSRPGLARLSRRIPRSSRSRACSTGNGSPRGDGIFAITLIYLRLWLNRKLDGWAGFCATYNRLATVPADQCPQAEFYLMCRAVLAHTGFNEGIVKANRPTARWETSAVRGRVNECDQREILRRWMGRPTRPQPTTSPSGLTQQQTDRGDRSLAHIRVLTLLLIL